MSKVSSRPPSRSTIFARMKPRLASEVELVDVFLGEDGRISKKQDPCLGVVRDRMIHAGHRVLCLERLAVDELLASPYCQITQRRRVPEDGVAHRAALHVGACGVGTAIARPDDLADLAGRLDGLANAGTSAG